jgi:general secretion pathway protein I
VNNSRNVRGFTLLEVLISLAIIGGLLVTLIVTLNYHLGLAARHETLTLATFLAKNKMSEMERKPENFKGNFEAPYAEYSFETILRGSPYAGVSEICVVVKHGNEEVRMNEYIPR